MSSYEYVENLWLADSMGVGRLTVEECADYMAALKKNEDEDKAYKETIGEDIREDDYMPDNLTPELFAEIWNGLVDRQENG